MTKLTTFFTSMLLGSLSCFAQKNYQPGYVIETSGDTIRGFIEYRSWDRNPTKINFKQIISSSPVSYQPSDVRAFYVGGERYESAIVDVDVSPHKIAELDANPLPVYVRDTVFLQILFQGEKSLYHFKDQHAKSHFYIYENGYEPLVYKQYLTSLYRFDNYEKKLAENLKYKGQLILYLKNCPGIESSMKNLKYQSQMLIKLFASYYQCTNKQAAYKNDLKEGTYGLGFMAGLSFASFDLGYKSGFKSLPLPNVYSPTFGFCYDFELMRAKRLSISNDLFYANLKMDAEYSKGGNGTVASTVKASFDLGYLKTNHIVRYDLTRSGTFFIGAGLSTGFVLKKKYHVTETYVTGLEADPEFNLKGQEFGYVAGIGAKIGKFNIEGRFDSTDGITNYSSTKRFHFLIKYYLIRKSR